MSKEEEIEMLKEKLDYYTLVATDEEFDAEEVIKIVKKAGRTWADRSTGKICRWIFGRFLEILRGTRKGGKNTRRISEAE